MPPNWADKTIWTGDNLPIMRRMNSASVDLIYLDPPFNSKTDYAAPIGSAAAGAAFKDTWTLGDVDAEWVNLLEKRHHGLWRVLLAAQTDSDKSYLAYMAVRLLEMHRLLKSTGSLYLHCDPYMSHYIKLMLDAIFGRSMFRNEIIWRIGWVSGFKPDRGWNGCMSLPRLLSLDQDDRLIQTPAPELEQLRGKHLKVENLSLTDELKAIEGAGGDALEIKAEFAPGDAGAFGLKVRCSRDGQNGLSLRYSDGTLNVAGTEVPLEAGSRTLKLHLFLDKSVLEVFIDEGRSAVTRVNYAPAEDLGIAVFAENGGAVLKSLDVWSMNSIW